MTLNESTIEMIIAAASRVERKKFAVTLECEMARYSQDTSYGKAIVRALSRIYEQVLLDD